MPRTVSIGRQSFEKIRANNNFYIDKTHFIKEWWEADDEVTLIARPRRFGKTLNMSMVEQFFSVDCAGMGSLFEGLKIWEDEKFRGIQGTYPVISFSFAAIKEKEYATARRKICQTLANLYSKNVFLKVALLTFSYFDTGKNPSESEPERFYHGFVLGLMVDLTDIFSPQIEKVGLGDMT